MELAGQLKAHRARIGLSQEELAERIYVSRQTISNWETDRTYPDVQSLLLLSSLFETSIDELVKGDVEAMEKAVESDWKKMNRLAVAAWSLVGLGVALFFAGFTVQTGPSSLLPKFSEGEVLGCVLFFVLWGIGLVLLGIVERLKKKNDLVTYRDILAFSRGEEPVRDEMAFSRRHPFATALIKLIASAAVGALVAFVVMSLAAFFL